MNPKNRVLPFGYQVKNGKTICNLNEQLEVRKIYADYLDGKSYQKIANDLTNRKICYLEGKYTWNKNRVKRILENKNYLGTELLPTIIGASIYERVQELISSKSDGKSETPIEVQKLKGKVKCGECGRTLKRYLTHKRSVYTCSDSNCKTSITFSALTSSFGPLLLQVSNTDELLLETDTELTDAEKNYLRQELEKEFKSEMLDEEKIKQLIISIALCEYKSTTGVDETDKAEQIKETISSEITDIDKITEISKYIIISKNSVGLKLKTEKIINLEKGD